MAGGGRRPGRGVLLHPVIRTRRPLIVLLVNSTDSGASGSSQTIAIATSSVDSGVLSDSSSSITTISAVSSSDSGVLTEAVAFKVLATDAATFAESWLFRLTTTDARTSAETTKFARTVVDSGVSTQSGSVVVVFSSPPTTGFDVAPAADLGVTQELATVTPIVAAGIFSTLNTFGGTTTLTQWAFIDPLGILAPYVFAVNPNQMTDPTRRKTTTSVGTSPLSSTKTRGYRTNRLTPREWTFSGVTIAQDQQDKFLTWFNIPNKIWLRDHFGRTWEVRLMRFDQEPRPSSRVNPLWRFKYTFTAQAYQRIS
jgi:hypothetical protein